MVAALGLALIVVPAAGPQNAWTVWAYVAGAASLMIGAIAIGWDVRQTIDSAAKLPKEERARLFGQYLFDRHATGLAFFFMVVVLLVSVVTTMLLYNGTLAITARDFAAQLSVSTGPLINGSGTGKGKVLSIVLLLSIALSWCGAGLFVVQRLETKRDDPEESFNFMEFFRGIWSRVGQANLYTLLFFLLIWANAEAMAAERVPGGTSPAAAWDIVKSYAWLPILGLVSGLLVKSAESVVFGLGARILAAVSGFLGTESNGGSKGGGKSDGEIADAVSAKANIVSATTGEKGDKGISPVVVELKGVKDKTRDDAGATDARAAAVLSDAVVNGEAPTIAVPTVVRTELAASVKPTSAASTPALGIKVNGNGSPGSGSAGLSAPVPVAISEASSDVSVARRRESSMVSSFGSSFSVPTSAPVAMTVLPVTVGESSAPSEVARSGRNGSAASPAHVASKGSAKNVANGATNGASNGASNGAANGFGHPDGNHGTGAPVRVVPVTVPGPSVMDVRPTIVPVSVPSLSSGSTSVMVNVERPEVAKLRDVVGPAPVAKAESSTTGIPSSSLWPALIRVVAPTRMSPNEPKILLPDLPEG